MLKLSLVKPLLWLVGAALVARIGVELYRELAGPPPPARPNFSSTDLEGRPFALADHRGKQPVLLSFFSLSCGPCRMEYPHLLEMQEKYRDRGLKIVLVGEDPVPAIRADQTYGKTPFTVLPNSTRIEDQYKIESLPHLVYFEPDGTVGEDIEGFGEGVLDPILHRLDRLPVQ